MTDLIAELAEVVRLSERATDGKWNVEPEGKNEFGQSEFAIEVFDGSCPIVGAGSFYGDPHDANLAASAVNFLRAHHAEIEEMARAKDVLAWFAGRDTGMSSEAIALHMTGVTTDDPCAPSDPSDLGRCLRLLERFPEWKPRIGEMARYGKHWARLIPKWNELAQMMADEVGIDWSKGRSAPLTYAAMHDSARDE